ncbi:6522_t:CDS:10 [Cetraspora pellucida]|uniref:6522_t:CDS:1 n=1 Tax=Cetraspora pellucida TaxID=1433469 RepID=A0A9N9CAU4_9GLOM|nr:6522_t:CDS:10 [Cetraspora pellucida]
MSYNKIDVSGDNGVNGENGSHGTDGNGHLPFIDKDGQHGGDATEPTQGRDGGEINLRLKLRRGYIEISGSYWNSRYDVKIVNESILSDDYDSIDLKARGGDGGHGGYGGNGGNGGTGYHGTNAVKYLPALDGGRGGEGGDAGAGTSGANGGKGGKITVSTYDTDSELLLMCNLDVDGGKGGKAGKHGRSGRGGSGGFGGIGCQYKELGFNIMQEGLVTYTPRSRQGGHRGFYGNSGWNPYSCYPLYDGNPGGEGDKQYKIINSQTGRVETYYQVFNLMLHDSAIHSSTGVFEPGAQIYVDNLTVHNTSMMPTPRRDIHVTINDSEWICKQNHAKLPHLINPRTSQRVDYYKSFSFFIKDHNVKIPEPPLRKSVKMFLTATTTGTKKTLTNFDTKGHPIKVQYPIEFISISNVNSMVAGQVSKVIWKVKNTSKVDFGVKSRNNRCIRIRLAKVGGKITSRSFLFGLQKGVAVIPPMQTLKTDYIIEIPLLRAGELLELEGTLKLGKAELFEGAEFRLYLELGKITAPSLPKVVHIESFDIRVSTFYRGITADFYPDQQLGFRFSVWDISQMGHFNFMRDISTTEPTTLMKDFNGKTIIILNNEFEFGNRTQKVKALQNFVLKNELLQAINKNDNRFYVVDPNNVKNDCAIALEEFLKVPFDTLKQDKLQFKHTGHEQTRKLKRLIKYCPNTEFHIIHQSSDEEKKDCYITVVPCHTTTKRRIILASVSDAHSDPEEFISKPINFKGVIASLGINNQFLLLKKVLTSKLTAEMTEILEVLKLQIIYDVAVELSTICDGIGYNSSLGDSQVLEMMENLRCLVLKVESLSKRYNESNTMFPVKHDTHLGKWMMDILSRLYAFIKCLRAGIHQSVLLNRRTAKVQQQAMDLFHRIGEAAISNFVDTRLLNQEQSTASGNEALICENMFTSRPWIPYKQLCSKRREIIKSFEGEVKSLLHQKIQMHYIKQKNDAKYVLGGIFDPLRKVMRRNAMDVIFKPYESFADNTLYGRNFEKKRDGQVGGTRNIIIIDETYIEKSRKNKIETQKINNYTSKFLEFKSKMIVSQDKNHVSSEETALISTIKLISKYYHIKYDTTQ